MTLPVVALVRQSSAVTADEVHAVAMALQRQVAEHFAPAWRGCDAIVVAAEPGAVPSGAWPILLVDRESTDGALGEHHDDGTPSGTVGILTCKDDGVPWSSCASHEVLELLADPYADACRGDGPAFVALEVCDPVEGQPYAIDGVPVERFVLPSWWVAGSSGPWDFTPPGGAPLLSAPLSRTAQGYIIRWDGTRWTQDVGAEMRPSKAAALLVGAPWTRAARRARGIVRRSDLAGLAARASG